MASNQDQWNNTGSGGNWNDADEWSNGLPNLGENAVLGAASTPYVVTLSGSGDAGRLEIGDNATLDMNGPAAKLHLAGSVVDRGTLQGEGVVQGGLSGNGTVLAEGGRLEIQGNVDQGHSTTDFEIGNNGTLALDGAVGSQTNSPIINFQDGTGTLDLTGEGGGVGGEPTLFHGQIAGFAMGDKVELAAGNADDALSVVNFNGETLVSVMDGATTVDALVLDGALNTSTEDLVLNQANGVDTISVQTICFFKGVRVATATGDVVVESLKSGDRVLTADGREVDVVWVGRQTVSMRFADKHRVLPVRVKAGALAENVPSRDLLVSPDHALRVGDVLIHAVALINGTSVVRETDVPEIFTYYHVETEDHSLILAENAPAETFVDNVDRLNFDNWAEHLAIYPEGRFVEEMSYPRAKSKRQIPSNVRAQLAERARQIGEPAAAVA